MTQPEPQYGAPRWAQLLIAFCFLLVLAFIGVAVVVGASRPIPTNIIEPPGQPKRVLTPLTPHCPSPRSPS